MTQSRTIEGSLLWHRLNSLSDTKKSVCALLLIWLGFSLSLWLLQKMGFTFGFNILPKGEDWHWVKFINEAKKVDYLPHVAHQFWAVDGRNPLSPWYWIAISPLVVKSTYSLYFVRCLMDPVLAITMYLLISRLCRQQNPLFAFSVALVTLMWNFFIVFSQLLWVFHCALTFSLCALFFYCRYIDEGRKNSEGDLALALLCYFVAIATYTLQAGTLIGIAAIGFFRKPYSTKHIQLAIKDTSFFIILFLLYYLIWNTTTSWLSAVIHAKPVTFHWQQLLKSIQLFLFHRDYLFFLNLVKRDWQFTLPVFIILTLGFGKLLSMLTRSHSFNEKADIPLGWIAVLLASITVPTLLLESSSDVFVPGTRSPMVSQVFQPLLYISFIFLIVYFIPFQKKVKNNIVILLVAILAAITATVSLEYNHALVQRSIMAIKNGDIPNYF